MDVDVTLERTEGSVEGDKRQHVPYLLKWMCPSCGVNCEIDFSDDYYLSYPEFPGVKKVGLNCKDCDHEETVTLSVDIVISLKRITVRERR